jgi:hypothetical protein
MNLKQRDIASIWALYFSLSLIMGAAGSFIEGAVVGSDWFWVTGYAFLSLGLAALGYSKFLHAGNKDQ